MKKLLNSNSFSSPVVREIFRFLTAIIGLVANLAGIWGTAYLMDAPALAENPTGGPGALLIAGLICTPIALVVGPISGIVGGVMSKIVAMRYKSESVMFQFVCGCIGGGFISFVVGTLPFMILQILNWLNIEGF